MTAVDELGTRASFPSLGQVRFLMIIGGAGLVGILWLLTLTELAGATWSLPFVGAYVGGVVALWRRPGAPAARRLLAFGSIATIFICAVLGLALAFEERGPQWWLGPANVGVQIVGLAMEAAMIGLLAVYPDGTYGRRYERWVVRAAAGAVLAVPIGLLITVPTVYPSWVFSWGTGTDPIALPDIASPLYLGALSFLAGPLTVLLEASLALGPLVGGTLVALRYRRLPARERVQIRWPSLGLLTLLLAPLALALNRVGLLSVPVTDLVAIIALTLLPASVVIGLVKPDLFDVDVAIRRTLVYAPLWIAIAGTYLGAAAALGLAASSQGLQVTVAVTILATLLFAPIRRQLTKGAARWAYGETLSGAEMARLLGQTLDNPHQPEQLTAAIARTVRQGLGVRWTRIRLVGLDPVCDGPVDGRAPAITAPMAHAGGHLGDIDCGPPVRGRIHRSDHEKLATLAGQAAVVIHNARLAAELRGRVDEIETQAAELAASRARIVAAHETARRGIERDIHDGAQQDLVALIARIGLARAQVDRHPAGLPVGTLDDLEVEAREALGNLRRLATGIHPTVLTDHGLLEAIESRAARLPIEAIVECDPQTRDTRFGDAVEGAGYFFVCEGLANSLKHSGAGQVRVRVGRAVGVLEIEVVDDGTGFEINGTPRAGLRGMSDRLAAIGGQLVVDSSPGRGTRLTARLPIADPT